MPIYEFVCRSCNQDFEKIVPSTQRDAVECPECGETKTARKISLAAPARTTVSVSAQTFGGGAGCDMPSCCGGGCGPPN